MSTVVGRPDAAPPVPGPAVVFEPGGPEDGGDAVPGRTDAARSVRRRSWPRVRRGSILRLLVSVEVGLVALVLRLFHIRTSYDLFVDELSYAKLARSIASGHGVVLDGQPFFLHPPAFFHELALILRIRGTPATLAATIVELRPFDAVAGALSAAFVTAVLLRVTRTPIAAAAGLVLAIDPFLNRFDSRLLLEAPAMAAAAAAVFVLGGPVDTRRAAVVRGVSAGALLALSATTKDLYVFVGAVPVAVAAILFRGSRRLAYGLAAGTAVLGYAAYVVTVVAGGQGRLWWAAKTVGVDRVLGRQQDTGFNKVGNPSLLSRLSANSGSDLGSYLLIGLGVLATLAVLVVAWRRRRDRPLRTATVFVGLWSAGAVVLLTYEIFLGTLEEQMFYPLLVVSLAVLTVAVDLLWSLARPALGWRVLKVAAATLLVLVLAVDVTTWRDVHTRRDDAYVQFIAWQRHGMVPTPTQPVPVVAATEDVAQFLMTGVVIGQWSTPAELVAHRVDYVVLSTTLTAQGYGLARPALEQLLDRVAPVVYEVTAPTVGQLRVYDVSAWVASQAEAPAPVRGLR